MFRFELEDAERELILYEALELGYSLVPLRDRIAYEEERTEEEILDCLTPYQREAYKRLCRGRSKG